MNDPTRALVIISLSLAAVMSGCGRQTGSDDDAADSDSDGISDLDMGTTSAECPLASLDLFETFPGQGYAAVMLPAPHEVNHATGSCGGTGPDQVYRVTSPGSSSYLLYAYADDPSLPLIVHVHAGDSCDGPELYCATRAEHEFALKLAEGEIVTVVVDTETDLAIPEQGLSYEVGLTWGPCEPELLHACNAAGVAELDECRATYACGAIDEAAMCYASFADDFDACTDEFCPGDSWESFDDCVAACDDHTSLCTTEYGCDANTCAYEQQLCRDFCGDCHAAEFEFEFADECELALPGPPSGWHANYVWVEVGGDQHLLSEPGLGCGDPRANDVVWTSDSSVLLCESVCTAFAIAGTATVVYGAPICE